MCSAAVVAMRKVINETLNDLLLSNQIVLNKKFNNPAGFELFIKRQRAKAKQVNKAIKKFEIYKIFLTN